MAEPIKAFDTLGNKVSIPAEQIADAQRLGYRVATPEDLAAEAVREEYGGTLNQLGAGASGVASGLTLGLSDIALSELGGRERLAAYELLYPTERMAGTVAGAVLPALLSAGTSAPASGASLAARALAATPAALATRAGAGVAARLGLAATQGVASGVGRTALRVGVAEGIESAIQGAGLEAGKLAINDKLSGERLGQIAAAGLTSGALGLGLGSGISALSGVASKAYAALPNGGSISGGLLKLRGRLAGKTGAELDEVAELANPEIRNMALNKERELNLVIEGKQAPGATQRIAQPESLQADLDAYWQGEQEAAMLIRDGSLKIKTIEGAVGSDADQLIAQRAFATTELPSAIATLDRIIAGEALEYNKVGLKELQYELVKASEAADAALARGGAVGAEELYGVLDVQAKRAIGRAASRLERLSAPTARDVRTRKEILEPMFDTFRTSLEDVPTWGKVATYQREMNAPMTRAIKDNPAVMANWFESIGFGDNPTNPWTTGKVSSAGKIRTNLEAAIDPGTNFADRSLRSQIANANGPQGWQSKALEYGNFQGNELQRYRTAIQKQQVISDRILGHLDRGTQIVTVGKRLDNLGGASDSFLSMMAGAAIGSGNPLFAAFAPLMKPRFVLRGAEMTDSIMRGGNASIAARATKAATAIAATAVDVGKKAAIVGSSAAEFDKKSKRVASLAEQTPAIAARIARDTEWAAPAAQREAVDTAVRQVDYLRSNLPQGLRAPTPFSQDLPATRAQVQGWLMRLRTVENPASLLDDVANGKLSPEAVDAVRTVYPAMFADMQARVVKKLLKLQSQGRSPSFAARAQLALLLGMPTDPLLMPSSMRAIQAQYAAQPGAAQGGAAPAPGRSRKVPQLASGFRSGSEETALTSDQP